MKRFAFVPIVAGVLLVLLAIVVTACGGQASPTPTATEPPPTAEPPQPTPEVASEPMAMDTGAAAYAVDLIAAWVNAGAPETEPFDYTGIDGNTYQATFEVDILPLFTQNNVWFEGSQACFGCHFGANENSYHELGMDSYADILKGADSISSPPGVSILGESSPGAGDFDWEHSKLRERLRNNRMPPGSPFDITEANRDGPCVDVSAEGVGVQLGKYDCENHAVDLIGAWVEAGAPNGEFEFAGVKLTFERDVLPFFTQPNMWFEGSQACSGCHFAASENSYHELGLGSYEDILKGADSISSPPGVSILGESSPGAGDFDWAHSKLRSRLRNNRMPPGSPFDITEANRDGPIVMAGKKK
jgi:hypothetical protein